MPGYSRKFIFTVFICSFPSLRLSQRESHRVAVNVIPILPYVLQEEPDS